MLFNDLFESDREPYQKAIDRLEMAHINNLNAKMDEIIGRVNREKLTDEHKAALKQEYIRLKAERDSMYGITEDGTPEFTVECDEEGNASVIDRIGQAIKHFTAKKYGSTAFDAATAYAGTRFKKANLDDIAGWENAAARKTGPVRLRPVVKQKPKTAEVVVSEWRNTAPGADEEQRKLKKVGIVRQKTHRMSEESTEHELDEEYKPVTRPVPQPKKLNPGWALDPTTKAELKRRKDVRNRVGVDEAQANVDPIILKALERLKPGLKGSGPGSALYSAAKEALALEYGLMRARSDSVFVQYLNQLQGLYAKRQSVNESSKTATAKEVLDYINRTHHEPFHSGEKMHDAVMAHPQWELKKVPLLNLNIPDQEYDDVDYDENPPETDPYGRTMTVDAGHAGQVSQAQIDKNPIVIDSDRYIIDGNHRAWAAKYLLNRQYINAWVPVNKLTNEGNSKLSPGEQMDAIMAKISRERITDPDVLDLLMKKYNLLKHKAQRIKEGDWSKAYDRKGNQVPVYIPSKDEDEVDEGIGDTLATVAKKAMGPLRVNAAVRRHDRKHDDAVERGDWKTAQKEISRSSKIDNRFRPLSDDQDMCKDQPLDEKWSEQYKDSINCSNPKGFSQKAHCAGRKKQDEGYHTNTIGAIAAAAPTFKPGDAIWVRNQSGEKVTGRVVELRPGLVVFRTEDGKRYRAPEGRVVRAMKEGSMADAEHHASGAKFGGYYRGTQVGAPRPGQSFGAESKEIGEGAKVDRMVKHIAKSQREAGKSKKEAEAIAWATANKRGMLDNANKKDEGMNFMEWAVAQGSRFANFASDPEVYSQARTAYLNEDIYGGIPKIAKVPTGAMYSNAKLPTLKTNLRKAKEKQARTAKALNRSLDENEQLDENWIELFNQASTAIAVYQFLKTSAIPVALFVAAVMAYGLHNTLKSAKEDENRFVKMAKAAWNKVDHSKVERMVAWLNDKFADAMEKMNIDNAHEYASDLVEKAEAEAELKPGQYYVWTVHFDDGTESRVKVTSDQFDPKAYYAKKNKVVIKTDYDWTIHG